MRRASATRTGRHTHDCRRAVRRAQGCPAGSGHSEAIAARAKWKLLAFVLLGAVLVAEVVLVAPYLERAWSALDRPDLRWLALAVVTELMSMGAFARVQRRMLSAGGARVPMCRMAALTYAANALSVSIPAGTALSSGYVFKRLRTWGATVPAAGFTIVASGLLSTLSFALLAVVCAVWAGNGGLGSLLVVAGAVAHRDCGAGNASLPQPRPADSDRRPRPDRGRTGSRIARRRPGSRRCAG